MVWNSALLSRHKARQQEDHSQIMDRNQKDAVIKAHGIAFEELRADLFRIDTRIEGLSLQINGDGYPVIYMIVEDIKAAEADKQLIKRISDFLKAKSDALTPDLQKAVPGYKRRAFGWVFE